MCRSIFKEERLLKCHLERKTPCAPAEVPVITNTNKENKCHYCSNTFTTKSSLTRHFKTCIVKKNPDIIRQLLLSNEEVIEEVRNGMAHLNEQVNNIKREQTVINNVNNISNNLYLRNELCLFGKEQFGMLDQDKIQKLFLDDPHNFVTGLISEIHNNASLPQYHNVYYEPKTEQAMVFVSMIINGVIVNTWKMKSMKEVSIQLVTKAKRYPTCMPLTNGIPPNSAKEKRYDQSMNIVTQQYEHSEKDLIANIKTLSNVTKMPGFTEMVEDTTYISGMLPLIHLN
jgi:hypothetical protein